MFAECKKMLKNSPTVLEYVKKAEQAHQNSSYSEAVAEMRNACRVYLEESSDFEGKEYAVLNQCLGKILEEFSKEKQNTVQDSGYKTAVYRPLS